MTSAREIQAFLEKHYPAPDYVVQNQAGGGAVAVLTDSIEVLDGEGVVQIPRGALVVGWVWYRDDVLPGWTSDSVQYVTDEFDGQNKAAIPGNRWNGNSNVALVMEGHVSPRGRVDPGE